MIGVDTNVLVRYLTQDEPDQCARANDLIETQCTRQQPGRVTIVVLCELVWVLRGAYRYDKTLAVTVLEQILATAELTVEQEAIASHALSAYRHGHADFADYVIAYGNQAAGCESTYSFDRKLGELDWVRAP